MISGKPAQIISAQRDITLVAVLNRPDEWHSRKAVITIAAVIIQRILKFFRIIS